MAHVEDPAFQMLKNKDMLLLLEMWDRLEYIEQDAYGMNAFTFLLVFCFV